VSSPDRVAKIYHQSVRPEKAEKLKAMARLATPDLLKFTAWPTAILHDTPNGSVAGFVMPRAVGQEVHALYSPAHRKQSFPQADWAFLVHTAMNCAAAFDTIHRARIVIGDVNQKKGQIVGSYQGHGFLLDKGNYTTLDVPGSSWTWASGINASGQIVGCYGDGNTSHGFLLDNGSYTTLDVPGSQSTSAYGINDLGQIVGSYTDGTGGHGFLLDIGSYSTLDVTGSTGTGASGINSSGQIVGSYHDASGGLHGFLATPVP
jgi:hypothetical protein